MKTCLNITAAVWPAKAGAIALRHGRLAMGLMFSLGLYRSYAGHRSTDEQNSLEASR